MCTQYTHTHTDVLSKLKINIFNICSQTEAKYLLLIVKHYKPNEFPQGY